MTYDPRDDGSLCDYCPIGPSGPLRDPSFPWTPVRSEFHPGSDVAAAILENPADVEVREGRPAAGDSGVKCWNPAMVAVGRSRAQVALLNTLSCYPGPPARGSYGRMEARLRTLNAELAAAGLPQWIHPREACRPRLEKEIQPFANLIALGGTALHTLTGTKRSILEASGDMIEVPTSDPEVKRKLVPLPHPAFVNAAPHYREFFEANLAKAFRWFENKRNWTEPIYEWRPSPQRLREWLREPARFTVHDYETTLDGPLRSRVYCIGFARLVEPAEWRTCEKCNGSGLRYLQFDREIGWVSAPNTLWHKPCECCGGQGIRLVEVHSVLVPILSCEDGESRFYTMGEEEQVKDAIREHMTDTSAWKVGHNLWGFDQLITEGWLGVTPWPVIDTLPLARARNPAAKKGLKIIGSMLCDIHAWGATVEGSRIAEAPRNDRQLHTYCGAGDASVNAKIFDTLMRDATYRGYFNPIREDLRPRSWPAHVPWTLQGVDDWRQGLCRHYMRAGMYVDQRKREQHGQRLLREYQENATRAREIAHGLGVNGGTRERGRHGHKVVEQIPFNPLSDRQVAQVVYNIYGFAPHHFSEETGQPSVDDESLREILTSPDATEDQRAFVGHVRKCRRAKKAKSNFVDRMAREDLWVPPTDRRGLVRKNVKPPVCWSDGRVHSNWSELLTEPARACSKEPNLNVIPVLYRDMFAAQPIYPEGDPRYPGRVMFGGDVDQFHLRLIANRWRITRLLEAFANNLDPHSMLAYDFFGPAFSHAEGWPNGFSLKVKDKPLKGSAADWMRHVAKVIRYRGAYKDTEEGILQSVREVEDPNTGDLPFARTTLREVRKHYRAWMRAEPEWERAWTWVQDTYRMNGDCLYSGLFGRRSGDCEGGKAQKVANTDILPLETDCFTLIEAGVREVFPDNCDGPGTGIIFSGYDALQVEAEGFAWTEIRNGKKVVVCDERTERRRREMEEAMNLDLSRQMGWEVKITAEVKVAPVRDEFGAVMLSNWKAA